MGEYFYNDLGDTTLYVNYKETGDKKSLQIVAKKFYYYPSGSTELTPGECTALNIYPNPLEQSAYIVLPEGVIPDYLEMYDLSGRMVRKERDFNSNIILLERKELTPQLYIIRVQADMPYVGTVMVK